MITAKEVHFLFSYDKETGHLIWKNPIANVTKKGDIAGSKSISRRKEGVRRVNIYGKSYSTAKIIWLYHYGEWPDSNLLRRNGVLSDTRIENLYLWKSGKKKMTYALAHKLFDYHKDGSLTSKNPLNRSVVEGQKVERLNTHGYETVQAYGKVYYVHRIIFLMHNGYFPENHIHHINGDKTDNRIENLQHVSNACHQKRTQTKNALKKGRVKGVVFNKQRKKWMATIYLDRKSILIGRFDDFHEAVLHRLAAEQCLDSNGCNEESPAYLYAVKHKLIKRRLGGGLR